MESTQSLYYSFDDTVDVRKHLAVPEAYNGKTALFDQLGAPVILGHLIQVMASVESRLQVPTEGMQSPR